MGADNNDMSKALKLVNWDLEDNLQSVLAQKATCDLIISNDKSFIKTSLPVMKAELFLVKYAIDT